MINQPLLNCPNCESTDIEIDCLDETETDLRKERERKGHCNDCGRGFRYQHRIFCMRGGESMNEVHASWIIGFSEGALIATILVSLYFLLVII